MRLRVAGLRRFVKADVAIEFSEDRLTSYSGLELVHRFWKRIDLVGRVRRSLARHWWSGDYEGARMVVLLVVLLVAGARRLHQLRHLAADPLIRRVTGLEKIPSTSTVRSWLRQFTQERVAALGELNRDLVSEQLARLGTRRITLDVDGTVVRTGNQVEWAFRGFNPHHRKDRSYYPLLAHVAQTGQILQLKNRPGNVHDSKGAVKFLRQLLSDLRSRFGRTMTLETRMDAAFFQREILRLLDREGCEYAIKVGFWKWVGLKPIVAARKRWYRIDDKLSYFETRLRLEAWDMDLPVVVYRKKVSHRTRKNFQLDLFSPDNGHYEYSAITTNKSLGGAALWHFAAGRGAQEKTIAELKGEFAFDVVPSRQYGANSAWQQISILAHNLMKSFQLETLAPAKARSRKRTATHLLRNMRTLRFEVIARAGRLCRPDGRQVLRVPRNPTTQQLYDDIIERLAA